MTQPSRMTQPATTRAPGSVVNLTAGAFERATSQGIVLIDFWAAWCGPCRAFAPVFEGAARHHPDALFAKVDTEAEPGLAAKFAIRAIPTLVVMRDGIPLLAQPGALPKAAIDALLSQVRALDMAEVRKTLTENTPHKTL